MTREEMYAYGCIFAINSLIEKGSSIYALYVNGKWEKIPRIEIAEWIEEHMQMKEPCDDTIHQKIGQWIKHEHNGIGYIECSECLYWSLEADLLRNNYCPNCGASMIEPQESEDKK